MADYPKGIKFPFRVQPAGGIGLVSEADKITSNLHALILTFVNERLIMKNVGTVGYMAVMRNTSMAGLIRSLVVEAITTYEKRATRLSVRIVPKEIRGEQHIFADVSYVFSLSGEPKNTSIQLT
jgi:hypothetical protein